MVNLLWLGDVVLILKRQTQKVKFLKFMWRGTLPSYKIKMVSVGRRSEREIEVSQHTGSFQSFCHGKNDPDRLYETL